MKKIKIESEDYENPWMFDDVPFKTKDIGDYLGFIYQITNLTNNKKYIGRKYFYQHRKLKGAKRKTTSESDWKKYYGSSDTLKADIKLLGKENFKREIISLHTALGDTNYSETKELFKRDVLESGKDVYYNYNILGRYFYNSINIDGRKISTKFTKDK